MLGGKGTSKTQTQSQ